MEIYLNRNIEEVMLNAFRYIEVKSSITYHPTFSKHISKLSDWINVPVTRKIIVYAGEFENTSGDISLINFRHINQYLPKIST